MTNSAPQFPRKLGSAEWVVAVFFLVGILVAFAVRYEMYIDGRQMLSHDESITFVAATGNFRNLDEARDRYSSRWVPAGEWGKFIQVSGWVSPAILAEGLAEYDIHPPLYFTILHVWAHAFGIEHARLLNFIFVALTCAALYALARSHFGSQIPAFLVVLVWLLNPEAMRVSAEARQYELLTLVTVVFGWQTYRLLNAKGRTPIRYFIGFGAAACLGMLTHYFFILFILAALLAAVISNRSLLPKTIVALLAGAVVFVVVHPYFYRSLLRLTERVEDNPPFGIAAKAVEVASTFLGFYGWRESWTTEYLAAAVLVVLALLFVAGTVLVVRLDALRPVLCFVLLPSILLVGLYMGGILPPHAMGPKYLAGVWPFLALLHVALFVRYLPRLQALAIAALAFVVGPAMLAIAVARVSADPLPNTYPAPAVVIDNLTAPYLPRYIRRYTDANTRVFAARQDKLIDEADSWIDSLKPGDLVILNPSYTGTLQGQEQLIDLIKRHHRLEWIRPIYRTTLVKIGR